MIGRDITISEKKNIKSVDSKEPDVEADFYYALSHDIRRRILKIIGDNGYSSFTTLKKELKVSTGTIYHHLDTLNPLIEQKEDKKYYLTELGLHAYISLKENISTITTPDFTIREFKSPLLKALMFVTPKKTIIIQKGKRSFTLLISILSIALGGIFTGLNLFFPFFLFFYESNTLIPSSEIGFQFFFSVLFVLNVFVYFIILEAICRLFYKKHENTIDFFLGFGIIFLPIDIYLVIHYFFQISNALEITPIRILDNILMILFQVWSLWLLTYSISVNKQMRIENSLINVLLIHYGGFSIFLLLSI